MSEDEVHIVDDQTSCSQVGSHDTAVGAIGSFFDLDFVEQASSSQEVPEQRSAGVLLEAQSLVQVRSRRLLRR